MRRWIVFSDLDGTLLDHHTYDFEPALPAIRRLQKLGVPIVLCSSKTAAEMIPLREQMGIHDPFVVENGGGLYFPRAAGLKVEGGEPRGRFLVASLGPRIGDINRFLRQFCTEEKVHIRSFLDLTPRQLAREAGLSEEQASQALKREFDLPLEPPPDAVAGKLREAARARGLRLTQGGRYWHLMGLADKGAAVKRVIDAYRRTWDCEVGSLALGDSLNDLEMLQAVDRPIVVPNPDSTADLRAHLPGAIEAPEPGPRGWCEAVKSLLEG